MLDFITQYPEILSHTAAATVGALIYRLFLELQPRPRQPDPALQIKPVVLQLKSETYIIDRIKEMYGQGVEQVQIARVLKLKPHQVNWQIKKHKFKKHTT